MRQRKQEPDRLYVEVEDWRGNVAELMNDGTLTTRYCSDGGDDKNILQTRAAFRGFVGCLTELLGYKVNSGYGEWDDEEGGEV
ncbi:MAG: hypothetical protein J6I49_03415 [Bacteroidales bacterium]|nr:hypothetical protein [Bacteroidales bacterium]